MKPGATTTVNKEAIWNAIGYTPHDAQKTVHDSDARFKVVCCGRRWGKSHMAARDIIPELFKQNKIWWIVGPTYILGEREFRVLYNDMAKLPKSLYGRCDIRYNRKAGDMSIRTPFGSEVTVVSAERPKSLQGEGLDGVIMAEAAQHNSQTWNQFIRPALSDKRGRAIFPSTPKGYNYFYEFWQRGQDPEYEEWQSWQYPTYTNTAVFNGFDDPELIEAQNALPEAIFRQEYMAEFTTFEGRIYDEFSENIHVRDLKYDPDMPNYCGVDFGFTNPFVCLDIQVGSDDSVYIWREYYKRHLPVIEHARHLKNRDNPPRYKINAMFGDPSGAGDIATLALEGFDVWGRKVPWEQGINAVKSKLKIQQDGSTKLFVDRSCINLIREMNMLRMVENHSPNRDPKEGQHKYDDHACDAMRYFFNEYFILGSGQSLLKAYRNERNPGGIFTYTNASPFTMTNRDRWKTVA